MSTKPSIFRKYKLGAHNAYKNPICMFLSELLLEPVSTIPSDVQLPTQSPKLHCNQTTVTIVEVKDLRKTIAIEKGIRKTSAWLEWIKYSILTLNKKYCYACASGRPELHVVPFPLGCTTNPDVLTYMVSLLQDRTAMWQ
jgi:hypothetical protein